MKRIYFFVGTTAELIKIAPVLGNLKRSKTKFKLVATGQNEIHFEEFFGLTGILEPDIRLPYKSNNSSIIGFFVWTLKTQIKSLFTIKKELNKDKSELLFVVHGDTVSSLIGAITAKLLRIKLAHVESGLRSFNFLEPFPEELSRYVISKIASIHYCPNDWAMKNLDYCRGEKINTYENVSVESYLWTKSFKISLQNKYNFPKKYFVILMHRQEHVIFRKEESMKVLNYVLRKTKKGLSAVVIVHDTSFKFINSFDTDKIFFRKVIRVPRLPYIDFMKLLEGAEFLVTDGGSTQEEMYFMGKPCLLLRKCTERIEGLGENVLLFRNDNKTIDKFLDKYETYNRKPVVLKRLPSLIVSKHLTTV